MKNDVAFLFKMDRVGACLSALCAIHCAVTPLLLAILPAAGIAFIGNEALEKGYIAVSLLMAAASHGWGFRIHRKRRVLFTLGMAVLFILAGQFLAPSSREWIFMVMGGAGLTVSHFLNRALCHRCLLCHHEESPTLNRS
jgi:hypothetical protein